MPPRNSNAPRRSWGSKPPDVFLIGHFRQPRTFLPPFLMENETKAAFLPVQMHKTRIF
jgi:hypothetical protein